jgi:hypothetical protein
MKSLVLFSYRQPVEGFKFRWGVLESRRDTEKHPVNNAAYRSDDPSTTTLEGKNSVCWFACQAFSGKIVGNS